MRLTSATISNFRSLSELTIEFDPYTALIGPNGSGKSSVLYALDWFFRGGGLSLEDVYREDADAADGTPGDEKSISVAVTFGELNEADRARLGRYATGGTATFRRTWRASDGKEKLVGNASQGPCFHTVREARLVGEVRAAYKQLRESVEGLEVLEGNFSKEDCENSMRRWEENPENSSLLEELSDVDATHLFGFNGTAIVNQCSRVILVPAALDIASQIGSTGKKTALSELVGALLAAAGEKAHAEWRARNAEVLDELRVSVASGILESTKRKAEVINGRLGTLVPGAEVRFTPNVPEWTPRTDVSVRTDVVLNGVANDVSRQGHGVQRAVMMTMLQSMAPDRASVTNSHVAEDNESEEDSKVRLEAELRNLPSLVIAIEEPEIYQHPIRARNFARVLTAIASDPHVQVVVATHSPYFVRPDQFTSLRRFSMRGPRTTVDRASLRAVKELADKPDSDVQKVVQKILPTSFSEGFFSDRVVLVEGDTDKAVLEIVASKCGRDLDANGVSVVDVGGKTSLRIPFAILSSLGIATYIVVDGDAKGSERGRHAMGSPGQIEARASHEKQTEDVIAWIPEAATVNATFDAPSEIASTFTLWHDDIEAELEQWPSFMSSLAACGGRIREKTMANYRSAALGANIEDMPTTLRSCVEAVVSC